MIQNYPSHFCESIGILFAIFGIVKLQIWILQVLIHFLTFLAIFKIAGNIPRICQRIFQADVMLTQRWRKRWRRRWLVSADRERPDRIPRWIWLCLGEKFTYIKSKNFQHESCRQWRDLPFHQRNFDLEQRVRKDLGFTPSDLKYCNTKFVRHTGWKDMRFIGIETYWWDLQLSWRNRRQTTEFRGRYQRVKFREYRISAFGKGKLDLVVFRGLYRG